MIQLKEKTIFADNSKESQRSILKEERAHYMRKFEKNKIV